MEDPAHEEGTDGGGRLGGHPDEPGEPVLGVSAPHHHVPRVDEQAGTEVFRGLQVRIKIVVVLSIYLSIYLLFLYLSIYLPIFLSIYISFYLSILSIYKRYLWNL